MTAINLFCAPQLKTVFAVADAAVYNAEGVVNSFTSKVIPITHLNAAIGTRGSAFCGNVIAYELAKRFSTFDATIGGIEIALPEIIREWDFQEAIIELLIFGWSTERNAAEAYVINATDAIPVGTTAEEAAHAAHRPAPFVLHRLPDCVDGPSVADLDLIIAADWEGVDQTDAESIAWSMAKFIEMQRQAVWADGGHWIGGFAQLTTVSPNNVSQRILARWSEDRVGVPLNPSPIDWTEWHAENPKPVPNNPIQLSRVRQDMMDRRARKALRK